MSFRAVTAEETGVEVVGKVSFLKRLACLLLPKYTHSVDVGGVVFVSRFCTFRGKFICLEVLLITPRDVVPSASDKYGDGPEFDPRMVSPNSGKG